LINDPIQTVVSFAAGFAIMAMTAFLGGAWACLAYRRLSPWLIVVAVGFVGECLALAGGLLGMIQARASLEYFYFHTMVWNGLALASTVTVVLGLVAALADLRRKLAISMEPPHVRH
jgi:hypothetical protein